MQKPKKTPRRREKEKRKIRLSIETKDFGPISDGKIALKPLTLFIGPNNSGKSYAAMLIHSLLEANLPKGMLIYPKTIGSFIEDFDFSAFREEFSEVEKKLNGFKKDEELEIPQQLIEKICNKIFQEIYERRLSKEIYSSYSCKPYELSRIGENYFELKICFNSYTIHLVIQKNKLKIRKYPKLNIKIRAKLIEQPFPGIKIDKKENGVFIIEIRGIYEKADRKFRTFLFERAILEAISSIIFQHIEHYYLPAARSGILQGYKLLSAVMWKKAPFIGMEKLEVPEFSGVVTDFISKIISLPKEKGTFYKLAHECEKELIKGKIIGKIVDKHLFDIHYIFEGTRIPLQRASSSVSELAPLFIYLKYFVEPGNILIIEEPEAHLHPENQRILAKYLVKLIRKNVNIIITTHSEYLLKQLSSFIMLSKIDPQKRVENYKYSKEDYLKSDEISAYVFNYDEIISGHKINEIEITEEDGIAQEEFLKIHEALYEETYKIQRELST